MSRRIDKRRKGMDMAGMRIGELAKKLDLNTQTIRYYERVGILPEPERTESGYRLYGEEDERRLEFIKNARNVGLTLGEVKEVLAFHERGEPPCAYVIETLARRAEEVERQISELRQFKSELDRLYESARSEPRQEPAPGSYCHIIG
jgi:DNA-binding transcriptional MerR regulator